MARAKRPLSDNDMDRIAHEKIWGKKPRTQGTQGSSNFRSAPQRSDSSVTNHYFNTPGDGSAHGHVKEQENPDGSKSYPYIRDVEGNEYDPQWAR